MSGARATFKPEDISSDWDPAPYRTMVVVGVICAPVALSVLFSKYTDGLAVRHAFCDTASLGFSLPQRPVHL